MRTPECMSLGGLDVAGLNANFPTKFQEQQFSWKRRGSTLLSW